MLKISDIYGGTPENKTRQNRVSEVTAHLTATI
jgi:hypothetical protein